MNPERWKRISDVAAAAWERDPASRDAFVDDACAGDAELSHEIKVLLASDREADEFLEDPVIPVQPGLEADRGDEECAPGARFGPYRIVRQIGQGGMGAVYLAERADGEYRKQVAIKLVRAEVAFQEVLQRFRLERQVLADLDHPNIARLVDGGVAGGIPYLVMDYVEGPTLADRIGQGPIPVAEAISIAGQVAGALEAAHEKGIVHRDLKPSNIKITPGGLVRVLDFGLARAPREEATASPEATVSGVIMGSAAYMSPEQSRGQPVDKRTDIWAFGVVLAEMVTGKRLFAGATVSDTMAAVLGREPDLSGTPARLQRVIAACLEKDARKRLRDIGDWSRLLAEPEGPRRRAPGRMPWPIAAALAGVALLSSWGWWRAENVRPERPLVQLDLDVGGAVTQPAISPDGRRLVFVLGGRLATRSLEESAIMPIAGTEGASFPFFSPDGAWIGFFANGKLRKTAATGGASIPLCDAPNGRGASWGDEGYIVAALGSSTGISRVSATDGSVQPLTDLTAEADQGVLSHRLPYALPGGAGVLFVAITAEKTTLRALPRGGGKSRNLLDNVAGVRVLADGRLLYDQLGTLFSAPLDPRRLELTGPGVPLISGIAHGSAREGDFDASRFGTVVFRRGVAAPQYVIGWLDSLGRREPLLSHPDGYLAPRISPDGNAIVFSVNREGRINLWRHDLNSGTTRRLTFGDGPETYPVWSPDGGFLAFLSRGRLAWMPAGGGRVEWLAGVVRTATPGSFSPDGKWLAFCQKDPETDSDLWLAPVSRDGAEMRVGSPSAMLRLPAGQTSPAISPDGKWVAYHSYESGRPEIYVMPFAPGGADGNERWQVSREGGQFPVWSRNGRELLYRRPDRRVMAASYQSANGLFSAGRERVWAERQLADIGADASFDVAADGKRIVGVFDASERKAEHSLRVLLNVDAEARRRAGRR